MLDNHLLLAGKGSVPVGICPAMANRHGLIAGATGTGKTITLQVLAEAFSDIGVPVFMADVKGDLTGLSQPGAAGGKAEARARLLGLAEHSFRPYPVRLWDVFGEDGHPVRTTISEMGPMLLSRLLGLNDTQTGVLHIVFKIADDQGLLLLDLKDLRQMLAHVAETASRYTVSYGMVSKQSIGAIQRALLTLETAGGEQFFGEPAMQVADLLTLAPDGRGIVHIMEASRLFRTPILYSTFLMWLLAELYELLPEAGDLAKPKLVFFFDEAHLLFDDAPKVLLDQVEQVVRLIRSKGVGVYFVTQNPTDIPDDIAGQLGNHVQHALRAFTPKEQRAVNAAAETFRPNPDVHVREAILALGVGEALVSFLDPSGVPNPVERAMMCPPRSRIGPVSPEERQALVRQSPLFGKYEQVFDRESAFEMLTGRVARPQAPEGGMPGQGTGAPHDAGAQRYGASAQQYGAGAQQYGGAGSQYGAEPDMSRTEAVRSGRRQPEDRDEPREAARPAARKSQGDPGWNRAANKAVERVVSSAASSVGRQLGNSLIRGIFGSLLKR